MNVSFKVELEALKETFDLGQPIELRFTVRNESQEPLKFCRYHTPFEGIRNEIFRVTPKDGTQALKYLGPLARRAPPGPEDYIELAPGESRSVVVDLKGFYAFEAGTFRVSFTGTKMNGLPDSPVIEIVLRAS